jgi:hypothetical protein
LKGVNVRFSLKALTGYVPEADIGRTSGRVDSVICIHQKTGTLYASQLTQLFVSEEGKTI